MSSIMTAHRRKRPFQVLAVLVVLLGVACSARGGVGEGQTEPVDEIGLIFVIDNQNWHTVHAYVIIESSVISLGQISSNSVNDYQLSAARVGREPTVRLLANAIGSKESFMSESILLRLGDTVEWTIRSPMALSSFLIK